MSFALNQHMVSDKRKWGLVFTALALVIIFLVVMVWSSFFTEWNRYCWNWAFFGGHNYDENGICVRCGAEKLDEVKPDDKKDDAAVRGGAALSVPEGQAGNVEVAFMSLAGSADLPAAVAANSWTISVTKVTPSSADNQRFDMEMKWENANSTWAKGKRVTDYGTLNHADGAKEGTFTNIKDFGEPILIVVTSQDKPELSKTVKVDYVQKITGFTFNLPAIGSETTSFTYEVDTTAYTIESKISLTFANKLKISVPFVTSVISNFPWGEIDCYPPLLSCNQTSRVITLSQDQDEFEANLSRPASIPGLVGLIAGVEESILQDNNLSIGDVIYAFRQAVNAVSGAHATFDITYKASYNGQDYSTGTKTVEVRFDGNALHVPIEDFTLNIDHIII